MDGPLEFSPRLEVEIFTAEKGFCQYTFAASTRRGKTIYPFLGIDQYDRDSIIQDFKSGVNTLLIATSVAARGLDVKNLILVVNFSCPNHYEDYVHRCGRTGRAGNKVGETVKKHTIGLKDFPKVSSPIV